jgi:hypothetical protein
LRTSFQPLFRAPVPVARQFLARIRRCLRAFLFTPAHPFSARAKRRLEVRFPEDLT